MTARALPRSLLREIHVACLTRRGGLPGLRNHFCVLTQLNGGSNSNGSGDSTHDMLLVGKVGYPARQVQVVVIYILLTNTLLVVTVALIRPLGSVVCSTGTGARLYCSASISSQPALQPQLGPS